jgi:hypothetical protein
MLLLPLLLTSCKPQEAPQPQPPAGQPAPQPAFVPDPALPPLPEDSTHGTRAKAPLFRPGPGAIVADYPYTAEQIRDSSPSGRVCIFRVTDPDGDTITKMEFLGADAEGVTVKSTVTTPEGEPVGDEESRSTWADLVEHASYPAGFTTITSVEVTVGAGTFQAKLYEVQDGAGGVDLKAWFADGMAGPPVKLEDHGDGEIIVAMEMLEQSLPEGS